jgi:hypothetical protein
MPLMPGQHLLARRGLYSHHGIYIGDGQVVHFSGLSKDKTTATIRRGTFAAFQNGSRVEVIPYRRAFSPHHVVRRALSRVGENGYHAFRNNCEHFARWCMTGEHRSPQVEKAGASAGGAAEGTGLAAVATAGAMALGETSKRRGAAALMKGFKAVGKPFGGGVPAGVIAAAAVPAIAANAAIRRALPDDPMLPTGERAARRAGRDTTAVASVFAGAGSIGLVSVAGVPGLSAVGITTGLAEIGGLFGGGMIAGAVATLALPAALAIALGLLVHHSRSKQTMAAIGGR